MKAKISPRINLEGRTRLESVIPLSIPFILFVDPSSSCNLKCKFCPSGHEELIKSTGRFQGQLNFDLYKKIIDNLKEFHEPLKVLRLYKDGEPLLNKNLDKMIKYAKESGCVKYIDTTTNGVLINKIRMKPIIDAGLDKINISLNGLSDKQFLEFSGVRVNFDKYLKNIEDFYEIKENCEIVIKIAGDCLTDVEKNMFYEKFGNVCDRIFIENTVPCWIGFDVEKYANIKINNVKGIYDNDLTNNCQVCPYIFYQLNVNSDGTVSLCFLDWCRKLIIGDVRKQSLKEIWESDILHNYQINNLNFKRKDIPSCKDCGHLIYCMPDNIDSYRIELFNKIKNKKELKTKKN